MRRTAPLILGGGPAGSAAAIMLARGGLRPLLIERSQGPRDVVCGGFLGGDALQALGRLGIDARLLGARPIGNLRLIAKGLVVEAPLPWPAAGLARRTLDNALLEAAEAAGTQVMRGTTVRAVDPDERSVRLDDGSEVEAETLLLATGKHEVRGASRQVEGLREAPAVGLRSALRASPALEAELDGCIELHLFDGGYAGLLLQEDGSANLCLSVSRDMLAGSNGIEALVEALGEAEPRLGARIAQGEAQQWIAVAGVPYGWRARRTREGFYRLGDQAAVIASLAGDGIAIALSSGMAAAKALMAPGGAAAERYQKAFARRARLPLATAGAIRWAAERDKPRHLLMRLLQVSPWLAPLAARLTRIHR